SLPASVSLPCVSACATAAPNVAPGRAVRCRVGPAAAMVRLEASVGAVSMTMVTSGRRDCRLREARVRSRYSPPPCATRIAVTRGCIESRLRALAQLAALSLGESAPNSEPLVVLQGVFEALRLHFAGGADSLGVARRAALLGKEGLGVGLRAQCVGLPRENTV